MPWSRIHRLILLGLGITWILDGIDLTIVGTIAPVLRYCDSLGLSAAEIGSAAFADVTGAVLPKKADAMLTGNAEDNVNQHAVAA